MRRVLRIINAVLWLGVWLTISMAWNGFEKFDLSPASQEVYGLVGLICVVCGVGIDTLIHPRIRNEPSKSKLPIYIGASIGFVALLYSKYLNGGYQTVYIYMIVISVMLLIYVLYRLLRSTITFRGEK